MIGGLSTTAFTLLAPQLQRAMGRGGWQGWILGDNNEVSNFDNVCAVCIDAEWQVWISAYIILKDSSRLHACYTLSHFQALHRPPDRSHWHAVGRGYSPHRDCNYCVRQHTLLPTAPGHHHRKCCSCHV